MSHTINRFRHITPVALYEGNFRRLVNLCPSISVMETGERCEHESTPLWLEVVEQHKYTTVLRLQKNLLESQHSFGDISMVLRVCFDANVVEVMNYQGRDAVRAVQPYPNEQMFYKDEKRQVNELLKEILEMAISQGRAMVPVQPVEDL